MNKKQLENYLSVLPFRHISEDETIEIINLIERNDLFRQIVMHSKFYQLVKSSINEPDTALLFKHLVDMARNNATAPLGEVLKLMDNMDYHRASSYITPLVNLAFAHDYNLEGDTAKLFSKFNQRTDYKNHLNGRFIAEASNIFARNEGLLSPGYRELVPYYAKRDALMLQYIRAADGYDIHQDLLVDFFRQVFNNIEKENQNIESLEPLRKVIDFLGNHNFINWWNTNRVQYKRTQKAEEMLDNDLLDILFHTIANYQENNMRALYIIFGMSEKNYPKIPSLLFVIRNILDERGVINNVGLEVLRGTPQTLLYQQPECLKLSSKLVYPEDIAAVEAELKNVNRRHRFIPKNIINLYAALTPDNEGLLTPLELLKKRVPEDQLTEEEIRMRIRSSNIK